MPTPSQGSTFYKADKQTLTFVMGYPANAYNLHTLEMLNLTNNNTTLYNNTDISITDNATGTISITANLTETGKYTAQVKSTNGANLIKHSPIYRFRVQDPIGTFT